MFRGRIPSNLAPQAPHLAIKVAAMGWDGGDPTDDQLTAMKRALTEWLDAGAVGMAAGLEYQPGALSPLSELVELCKLVAATGGYEASMHRLDDSAQRARLRDETAARIAERGAITLSCVESGGELEGKQLGTLARESQQQDVDAMFDLLSSHAGRALAIYHWPQSIPGEAIIKRSLAHPLYIGSTDGIYMGSRPHRRGYGSFARIVGEYVRDGTLTLEQAVHK